MTTVEQITARILDRDYRLSCASDEKQALLAAVDRVDRAMRDIRAQGKVTSPERIAVLAALQLASTSDLPPAVASTASIPSAASTPATASTPSTAAVADPAIARRMQAIEALLDDALGRQEPLF